MTNCNLKIETISEDTTVFRAAAVFETHEGGGRVVYPVELDEGTITFDKDGIAMERRGACSLSAVFRAGARSEMRLFSGGGKGMIPVETTSYSLEKKSFGYRLVLEYILKGSDCIQKFHLKITVKFSEEK